MAEGAKARQIEPRTNGDVEVAVGHGFMQQLTQSDALLEDVLVIMLECCTSL